MMAITKHTSPDTTIQAIGVRQRIENLPMLPRTAMEVLQMVENPSVAIKDVTATICTDPALCARILKVANSSLYGLPRQISQIERAVLLLGLKVVRNLIIIASMDRFFHMNRDAGAFRSLSDDLWQHSTLTATAAKMLADAMPVKHPEISSDELMVAGLIHDIGIMAELHTDRTRLIDAMVTMFGQDANRFDLQNVQPAEQPDLRIIETELFGEDHAALGAMLCEYWQFPFFLCQCVAWHHPLDQSGNAHILPANMQTAAALICTADRLAGSLPNGFRFDLPTTEIEQCHIELLGLDQQTILKLRDQLTQQVSAIGEVFS